MADWQRETSAHRCGDQQALFLSKFDHHQYGPHGGNLAQANGRQ
jgi:hypothetical protein